MRRFVYQCGYCGDWTWTMVTDEDRKLLSDLLARKDDARYADDLFYGAACDWCWGK